MPTSNNSVSSSQDGEEFFSNGACGHIYFKGTLKEFRKTTEEFKVSFIKAAKAANIGENEALQKMLVLLLDKVKDPSNTFNTKALDCTLFGVNVDQYKLYKLGFDTSCFFVQMPVSDNDTLNSVDAVVATIQENTTSISESARNDAYRQFKESCVNRDGSIAMRVSTSRYASSTISAFHTLTLLAVLLQLYAVAPPQGIKFDIGDGEILFNEDKKNGDLSCHRTLTEKPLANKVSPTIKDLTDTFGPLLEEYLQNGTFDSMDAAIEHYFNQVPGSVISLSWQIPILCEKEMIGKGDESDDESSEEEDLRTNMNSMASAINNVMKSMSKTPPRTTG